MDGLWGLILSIIFSRLIFSFLFYILNSKIYGVFDPMQMDLGKLSCTNRRILYFTGHALSISITILIGIKFSISRVVAGLILGFLTALIDICFGDSVIGSVPKKS